jgi:type I restriction-modification system DNA methylase subunit
MNQELEKTLWATTDKLRNNMDAIEKDNPTLKGVLPKDYARPALDKKRLGELLDLL